MGLIEILKGEQNVSRRDFLKNAVKVAIPAIVAEDVVMNLVLQYAQGQMDLDPLLKDYAIVGSASEEMISRAAKTGEVEFTIYDVSFDDSKKPLNYEKLKQNIDWIFGTLDENLKINIEYKRITPYNPVVFFERDELSAEDMKDPILKKRMDGIINKYAEEFEETVKNTEVTSNESTSVFNKLISEGKVNKGLVYNLDIYLMNYLNRSELDKHFRTDKANILIGDFKKSGFYGESKETLGKTYILLSDEYSDEKSYAEVIAHELSHKLGLPHTLNPYDVMSYAPFAQKFGKLTGKLGFSIESSKIWSKIKNHYRAE